MTCRGGCGSGSSYTSGSCIKGTGAIGFCGDGVPSEQGGVGCYTASLAVSSTNTVYMGQYGIEGIEGLWAKVRIGAAGSNLIYEVDDVGVYAPDLVSSDESLIITGPDRGEVGSRDISLQLSEEYGQGIEKITTDDADSRQVGLYVPKWVHEMYEFVGDEAHALGLSSEVVSDAMASLGTPTMPDGVETLVASYENKHDVWVYVAFDVIWGSTQIHGWDTAQQVIVTHAATMNFGLASDFNSESAYGTLVNDGTSDSANSYQIRFPKSSARYFTELPPGGLAKLSAFNMVTAYGGVPEDSSQRWSLEWDAPRIVVTVLSKSNIIEG